MKNIFSGPLPARVMIVGEAPGNEELNSGRPFTGLYGQELTAMLAEAGINRSECFITNVTSVRPPNNDVENFFLKKTEAKLLNIKEFKGRYAKSEIIQGVEQLRLMINAVEPELIIALGETALWALTGNRGIMNWRGSHLRWDGDLKTRVIPTIHPNAVLRQWSYRFLAMADLRRVKRILDNPFEFMTPPWDFKVRPSFDQAEQWLDELELKLYNSPFIVCDIETRGGQIACVGIATDKLNAFCIPFMSAESPDGSYWNFAEELFLRSRLADIFRNPQAKVCFHNGAYDVQYFAKELGIAPYVLHDTMLLQHVCFPGLRKSLALCSSLYCIHHRYWKDDGKNWSGKMDETQLWTYNCEDCVRTFEICETLTTVVHQLDLYSQYKFQMYELFPQVLKTMLRGIKVDHKLRLELDMKLEAKKQEILKWFEAVLGHPLNPNSNLQMKNLFYKDFNCNIVINRKTRQPTLDDEALEKIKKRNPLLRPLIEAISTYRSVGVFLSTFVRAPLSPDGRMRCTYNLAGTETFRFSSSEDSFGYGTNLQNLPSGDEDDTQDIFHLPNLRDMFIPDEGMVIFEADLAGADAQVVAWDAADEKLKKAFRKRLAVHFENAKDIFKDPALQKCPSDKACKSDSRLNVFRQRAKIGVHATNYGVKERTLAASLNISVGEAKKFITSWLTAHPAIARWHETTQEKLEKTRTISNAFGYKRFYFDRIETLLPQALAWTPQSTVAITVNKGWVEVANSISGIEILLQVHDSIVGQFPASRQAEILPKIQKAMEVKIPYADPLIIPVSLKISPVRWGAAHEVTL